MIPHKAVSYTHLPYYVSENEYTDYNLCMEKKDRNICFFSTEQNYQVNFKPLGGYIYKEVNNAILNRKINIYFMSNQKKQYQQIGRAHV